MKITNPLDSKKSLRKRLLIDSGSVFSVLPDSELRGLGIKPDSKQKFILANGDEIEKEVGEARFVWGSTARTAPVVFGDRNVYLLGATTLETMGLILDPINRKLEKLPMLL